MKIRVKIANLGIIMMPGPPIALATGGRAKQNLFACRRITGWRLHGVWPLGLPRRESFPLPDSIGA